MARRKSINKLGYRFTSIPTHILVGSKEYSILTGNQVKLLLDLFAQYNGFNNGDFCCTWSYMIKRGWKSEDTLFKTLRTLEESGFIIRTRQGGRNKCNLYGVTWLSIDDCDGKLDIPAQRVASHLWKK
jgi:hypothetical protein